MAIQVYSWKMRHRNGYQSVVCGEGESYALKGWFEICT
jgi:hypothetical protein